MTVLIIYKKTNTVL